MKHAVKRPADLVARYGGEEFAVILPNTDGEGAFRVAEEIQLSVRTLGVLHPKSPISEFVTLSVGISCAIPWHKGAPEALIAAADRALYQAKQLGRDRAVMIPLTNADSRDVCTR
jgi:diguanylate cyclase (GGDEF)-like protein